MLVSCTIRIPSQTSPNQLETEPVDFYPWTGNGVEDHLNETVVKTGFTNKPLSNNETNTARQAVWVHNLKGNRNGLGALSSLFIAVLEKLGDIRAKPEIESKSVNKQWRFTKPAMPANTAFTELLNEAAHSSGDSPTVNPDLSNNGVTAAQRQNSTEETTTSAPATLEGIIDPGRESAKSAENASETPAKRKPGRPKGSIKKTPGSSDNIACAAKEKPNHVSAKSTSAKKVDIGSELQMYSTNLTVRFLEQTLAWQGSGTLGTPNGYGIFVEKFSPYNPKSSMCSKIE